VVLSINTKLNASGNHIALNSNSEVYCFKSLDSIQSVEFVLRTSIEAAKMFNNTSPPTKLSPEQWNLLATNMGFASLGEFNLQFNQHYVIAKQYFQYRSCYQ